MLIVIIMFLEEYPYLEAKEIKAQHVMGELVDLVCNKSIHLDFDLNWPLKFPENNNWSIAGWTYCDKRNIFLNIFFFIATIKLRISQAFRLHQARQILILYKPVVNLCSKWVVNYFFLNFLRSSYMQPCGQNCPRAKR
jgi:hypothetical protein